MHTHQLYHTTLAGFAAAELAARPDLQTVLACLDTASQRIGDALKQGALAGILGSAGADNVQGEEQKKLDVLANNILLEVFAGSQVVAACASEELDTFTPANANAQALVLFDPLDGSSNIDINMAVGTIVSVLDRVSPVGSAVSELDFLQPGTAQVMAAYVLYGPATQLVLTVGTGVYAFTLDLKQGCYLLTAMHMQVAADTQEFAINMSNQRHWQQPVQQYIAECIDGKLGVRGKSFNMRWVAAMVGDVHRILIRGGVFLYPLDNKDANKPAKLRLMYEANPLGWIIEQAGGACSTGTAPILSIQPSSIHQRVGVILGASNEVERLVAYHQAT